MTALKAYLFPKSFWEHNKGKNSVLRGGVWRDTEGDCLAEKLETDFLALGIPKRSSGTRKK
jgi:hypothetical protein